MGLRSRGVTSAGEPQKTPGLKQAATLFAAAALLCVLSCTICVLHLRTLAVSLLRNSDDQWDYCDVSCDAPPTGAARCSVTVTGHQCDEWGENDFGLDPTSNACEQVDGLDKPWCYFGEDDDQWDFCDCAAVAVAAGGGGGGGGSDSASTSTVKATASDWEKTDRTDADGNPLQRIDMKTLMLQGKITRWWWDMNNPSSTRLTDQNFDNEVGSRDYFVR